MATWLDFVAMLPKGRPPNPMSRTQLVQALVGALLQRLDLMACRSFPPVDTIFTALVDYFQAEGLLTLNEDLRRPDGPCSSFHMHFSASCRGRKPPPALFMHGGFMCHDSACLLLVSADPFHLRCLSG